MAGITTSSTLSAQFQALFSKELLQYAVQETVLDQFGIPAPVAKNTGHKSISMFRQGAPSIADVKALTEGTAISSSNYRQLSLTAVTKSLAQYGQVIGITDIERATELFNTMSQATRITGQDFGLWYDSVVRNVLIASNLTTSNGSIGSAEEGAGTHDNSDVITEVYGRPASTTQSYTGLNSDTTTCTLDAPTLLDLMTKLTKNRAPKLKGGYVYVTDPRTARDLMRDTDWLAASNYGNKGEPLYKGEVGSLYGMKVVIQTNSFVSLGSATATDRFIYAVSGGGGTAVSKDIICSIAMGGGAFAIPQLGGTSAASPEVIITNTPDKSDPLNQLVTVGAKAYFTALRTNTSYYIVHRAKTANTL